MNSKRSLMTLVTALTIFSMLLSMAIPVANFVAQAQDAPGETPTDAAAPTEVVPTDIPTDAPTVEPTALPTEEVTAAPTEAPTDLPTDVPTEAATGEVTEVPTDTPTDVPTATPTEIPTISVFQDDFQDGNVDGWSLTPGWTIGVEGENLFLTTSTPNELAEISNLNLADFSFAARIRLDAGNQVHVQFRSSTEAYDLALDAAGNTSLTRGAAALALGTAIAPVDASAGPVWHTLNIQVVGSSITVSVDGDAQISYTDPTPLLEGGIRLLTDAVNTGAVSIDQVMIGQPQTPVVTETPIAVTETPETTETAVPTEEATAEITPTVEPTVTGQLILSADFESDLVGWTASEGTSVVLDTDTNHALLMAAGSTFTPTDPVYLAGFQLDARLNITTNAQDGSTTGVSFAFRTQDGKTYALSVEAGQTVLYRNDGEGATVLSSTPTAHSLNTWHSLSLNAQDGHILVTIDGAVELDYSDAEPLTNGQIAFVANPGSSVMLDDITLTDYSVSAMETSVTPIPAGLSDEEKARLPGALAAALDLYLKGDTEGALNFAAAYFIPMDEQGRVRVVIRATAETDGQTMAALVQQVGGSVESVYEDQVNANIPLTSFIPLMNTPQIGTIELASIAVSTSSVQSPAAAPAAGKAIGEGYDIVGANDWNLANVKGAAQKIAVIDTGFVGGVPAGEGCATNGGPIGGAGSGNHGIQVVQVICDIAPSAAITMYQADTAAELSTQLTAANGNDIILITLDLGVSASPGDGTGGTDANVAAVYTKIASARAAGKLVIVAAGNSHGRQVNFQYPGGGANVVVPILATAGDIVRVSWSDWSGSTDYTTKLDDIADANGITSATGISANTPTRSSGPPSRFFTIPSAPPLLGGGVGTWPHQRFAVANPPTPVDPGSPPAGAIGCYNNTSILPTAAGAVRNYCELQLTISGSASAYFQVQVQTQVSYPIFEFDTDNAFSLPFGESSVINGSVTGGATNINTNSTIGRPADSPSALTVGAVCAFGAELDPAVNYHILDTSSRGPILAMGGAGVSSPPLATRTSYKPNLVAPSDVSTSFDLKLPGDTGKDSSQCNDNDNDGFSGTSAAAAHVAAMAALIRSNTNPNLDANVSASININTDPDAIIDYMQSHSVDLYGENGTQPDGFDMTYGSGMAVLGNPAPTQPIAVDPASFTGNTATCPGGTVVYVSPFNLSVERNLTSMGSTLANPYITPSQALANAPNNACIIFLPGEYISHVIMNNAVMASTIKLQSYKIAPKTVAPATTPGESTFWVNVSFGAAGLSIRSTGAVNRNITIDGFQFLGANALSQRDDDGSGSNPSFPPNAFPYPSAIGSRFSDGNITITNNTFSGFHQSAIAIASSADTSGSVTIQDNVFKDNFSSNGAAINIGSSGRSGVPILALYNTYERNRYIDCAQGIKDFQPVIQITDSVANIYNNRFLNNQIRQAGDPTLIISPTCRAPETSIIRVVNKDIDFSDPIHPVEYIPPSPFTVSKEVRVIGNAIFDNGNNGPVVDLEPNRRFRFINNTVVGNNKISSEPIIRRGTTGATINSDGATEIYNNVFFQTDINGSVSGVFNDIGLTDTACYDFSGNANSGAKNNWIYDVASALGGDCIFSLGNKPGGSLGAVDPTFKNVVNEPAHPITLASFVGATIAPNDPYQIPGDSFGIGYGNNALVPGGSITTDVLKKPRIDPVGGNIDVGAYEYKAVTGTDFSVTIPEDTLSSPIIMNAHVQGGFPPYKFLILNKPKNFGTSSTNACGGSPLALTLDAQLQNIITYCPPPDFYNNSGAPAEAAVTFTYQVGDNSSTTFTDPPHTVTITVTKATSGATKDDPLSTAVPLYTVLGEANKPISFRLRPFVRFQNFRFSETNNQSEYPFTYSNALIQNTGQEGEDTGLFTQSQLNNALASADYTGLITLTPATNHLGFLEFTYSVTDDPALDLASNTTNGNRVRVKVVGSIPDSGLHDDTSFNFTYQGATAANPGVWTPVYNETAINNTLHTSVTANDTAEFVMNGSGFALYMQGAAAGGNWELQIDNGGVLNTLAWTPSTPVGRYNGKNTDGSITCTTAATTAAGTLISNKTVAPYVVSCTGLIEGEANTIRVINKENKALSIDALGILLDTSPLLKGFHEVTESQTSSMFFGWTLLTDLKASGQRAMTTTNPNIADVQFTFHGTGFAIGTALELKGAKYNICAAPSLTPANRVCQSFDNALGGTAAALYNVFRPFTGFDDDPAKDYDVTIDVTSIPTGGRMLIDSIVVFDKKPSAALSLGTTEDDQIGLIDFGGGLEDSWILDTTNIKASNSSLTSVSSLVKAGPYADFRIPDGADTINWYRIAATTDSNQILICVDRAQGDIAGDQSTHCIKKDLKTAGNPVVIKESDFDYDGTLSGATGWGPAWGTGNTHTVEIFSLTNQPFNIDKLQVLDSDAQLLAGYYEENTPGVRFFTEATGTYTLLANGDNGNFTDVTLATASGGKYKQLSADNLSVAGVDTQNLNEGMFFQFTGTGFSVYFIMDTKADAVRICYVNNVFGGNPTGANIPTILGGTCQNFDNQSTVVRYKAGRTIAGLPADSYSVVVQMLDDQGEPLPHTTATKPITMKVDAVEVYNHNPMPANVLTAINTRFETSYVNRVADARFVYIGTGWKSVSGAAAALYSGSNYDSLANVIGGGVAFRTDGTSSQADTVIIYRDTRAAFAPIQVCVERLSPLARRCVIIGNAGGTGYQQPIAVPLFDNTPHNVTITTADFGTFNLDAIALANNTALAAGIYEENNAAITYSNTTDANKPIRSHWTDIALASYTDKGAMQSNTIGASMKFTFTGTGFSLLTLRDTLSGSLKVDLDGTGGNDYLNQVFNSNNTTTVYGSAHTIAGLTFDTYNVTITENDPSKHRFTVDGLEIYGDYDTNQAIGAGIYDDASTNPNNNNKPYLTFGPNNGTWTVKTSAATGYFNLTNHLTARYGATSTFVVDNAGLVTLFHNLSTTTSLRVCAKPLGATDGLSSWKCGTNTTVGRATTSISLTNGTADISLNAGGVGDYIISVTNLVNAKNLFIDAVGVSPTPTMGEGIYPESSPLLNFSTGTWLPGSTAEAAATDKFVKSTGVGNSGDAMSFSFSGTGFSIVLVEGTTTSSGYTLAVTSAGTCGGFAPINQSLTPVGATAAKKPVALTYVGLDVGTSCTYTVTLTNTDSAKPMLVDRVDILGAFTASRQIANGELGNIENTDSRITYFPFFSYNPVVVTGPSGGSQHTGTMMGSVVYFELNDFTGTGFDYIRQTLATYGSASICTGAKGTNSSTCTPTSVANNTAPLGYQQAFTVGVTPGADYNWVAIKNSDGKTMPLDFIRPRDVNQPITAGVFEENYPELKYVNSAGTPTAFLPVINPLASGGATLATTTVGDAMMFQFTGTGFGIRFTLDSKADAVKICWVNSLTTNLATVLGGTCQTPDFDNQSSVARYQSLRVIHGLASGNYTAAVQMQADNNTPAPHAVAATPITMQIDGVAVFNDNWNGLTQLTTGSRTETSFVNAVAQHQFIYLGAGWKSVSGTAAKLYSGQNYDTISNVIGAGVVFRTNGGDSILLYRDVKVGNAPVLVCAARESTPSNRLCTIVTNSATSPVVQQPARIMLNNTGNTSPHVVTITTLDAGLFNLDAIEVVNSGAALQPGLYEDVYPGLTYNNPNLTTGETAWGSIFAATYTGGRAQQTIDNDAEMIFHITNATGFEIGTAMDKFGGEVEICYNSSNDTAFPVGPTTKCFVYEEERAVASTTVSRTVTGFNTVSTYAVRLRNVEDGKSVPTYAPRLAVNTPSRLRLDYVQVFGTALPTVVPAGFYNENAVDGGGVPYLQLLPANRWGVVSNATGFSFKSYTTVVGTTNVASAIYAGPVATLRVAVPNGAGAASSATVILFTGPVIATSTDRLLVCANDVAGADPLTSSPPATLGTDCTIITNLKTSTQIILNESILSALGADGTTVTLSFRALNPGTFRIDGFQVISGTTLTTGIYDDTLFSSSGIIAAADVTATGKWTLVPATTTKIATAYGGSIAIAQSTAASTDDPTLKFDFNGTGFSIITMADGLGVDMRICYKLTSSGTAFPVSSVLNQGGNLQAGNVLCHTRSTDTTLADWKLRNGGEPNLATAPQYGFDYHGLPLGNYSVEVRMVDTTLAATDRLKIDAIAIFGAASGSPLTAGSIYDNTQASLTLSPSPFWTQTTTTLSPPKGPWNKTLTTTTAAGAITQMNVTGNAVIVYQSATGTSSRYVKVCLTTSFGQECSTFSQNKAAVTYFSPIIFYGLGTSGTHEVILENRDPGKTMSIDAIRVLP